MTQKRSPIRDRDDLIRQLGVAAELEHGLALQYLFTAFTLKQSTDEGGLTPEELQQVLRWKSELFFVAAQEMQHMVQAANLAMSVGGAAHLRRPNFPQPPWYYPTDLPWGLWPFSEHTLGLYASYERPASVSPDHPCAQFDAPALFRLRQPPGRAPGAGQGGPSGDPAHAFDHLPGALFQDLRPRASRYETIGQLYGAIAEAFARLLPDRLLIGAPAIQVSAGESHFPQVREILTREDALRAIRLIVEQGEGDEELAVKEVAVADSHFGVFCRIRRQLEELTRKAHEHGRTFEPARDVAANPLSRLHVDTWYPGYRLIEDPFTRQVNDLFSDVYETMLLMLYRFFATEADPGLRERYSAGFFGIMMQVLEPLGEILTTLPMGEDPAAQAYRPLQAGPSFEITRFVELLPQAAQSLVIVEESLRRESALALALGREPDAPPGLTAVAEQLDSIARDLRRGPSAPPPRRHREGQPSMTALPPVPKGQEIFYYASQTTFWLYFRVDRRRVEDAVGHILKPLGLSLATFEGDEDKAYVALVPMVYTATFDNSMAAISEAELNVLVYPSAEARRVPKLDFHQFLLGWEQQKVVGQYRLDVICDNRAAVLGGRDKYGEHKFLGEISYWLPVPNDNSRQPEAFRIELAAFQEPRPGQERELCFRFEASTAGLAPFQSNGSEVVVYGALPPEPSPGSKQRTVGTRRNYLGLFEGYTVTGQGGSFHIDYGDCHDGPPLRNKNGDPIPGSGEWPRQMRERMQALLTDASLAAFQLFRSPPVEIEPRPYYVNPE